MTDRELYGRVTADLDINSRAYVDALSEADKRYGGDGSHAHLLPRHDPLLAEIASTVDFTSLTVQIVAAHDPHPESQRRKALIKMDLHIGGDGDGSGSRLLTSWNNADVADFNEEYWLLNGQAHAGSGLSAQAQGYPHPPPRQLSYEMRVVVHRCDRSVGAVQLVDALPVG